MIRETNQRIITIDLNNEKQCKQIFRQEKIYILTKISKLTNEVIWELKPKTGYIYGDLPRGMKPEVFLQVMYAIPRDKRTWAEFLMLFFFMLRVGERKGLAGLYNQGLLKITNYKGKRIDHLPLHGPTARLVEYYMSIPKRGYNWMHKTFTQAIQLINKEHIYHEYTLDTTSRAGRDLTVTYHRRQHTLHSIRHTGITMFRKVNHDPIHALRIGRWKKNVIFGMPETYDTYTYEDMQKDLEKTFEPFYNLIDICLSLPELKYSKIRGEKIKDSEINKLIEEINNMQKEAIKI